MKANNEADVEKYIKKIEKRCDCTHLQVETVVLTQLAIMLGDLAVNKSSDMVLGTLQVDKDQNITLKPNDFLRGVLEGEVDPFLLLNEFIKKC